MPKMGPNLTPISPGAVEEFRRAEIEEQQKERWHDPGTHCPGKTCELVRNPQVRMREGA